MNDDGNVAHKYFAPFLSSNTQENVSTGTEFESAKFRVCHHKNMIMDLLLKVSKSFEWQVSLLIFF